MLDTGRKLRVQYPRAICHVMNCGDRQEAIVREDAERPGQRCRPAVLGSVPGRAGSGEDGRDYKSRAWWHIARG
jgi:hypothetical protein